MCCGVLRNLAVCCSALQYVAVRFSKDKWQFMYKYTYMYIYISYKASPLHTSAQGEAEKKKKLDFRPKEPYFCRAILQKRPVVFCRVTVQSDLLFAYSA